MILSFHPCFKADHNIICAGRPPGPSDLAAIQAAQAVILPQGSSIALYRLARENCPNVFPNLDARFDYPGKSGQISLFKKYQTPHPKTQICENLEEFQKNLSKSNIPLSFPFIIKLDWGGQGEGVFYIDSEANLQTALSRVATFESSGQSRFLIQEFIACNNRSLRVVIIGERLVSYWRVQKEDKAFFTHVSKGATIDHTSDPALQEAAKTATKRLCRKTGINLAGFDIIFSIDKKDRFHEPLFLEINYFFGRSGLGGSQVFYELLTEEIRKWLEKLKL